MNTSIRAFLLVFTVCSISVLTLSHSLPDKPAKAGTAQIVFASADGGQTWQDISKGLPDILREEGIKGNTILANDKGLFVNVGNERYHHTPNATTPLWTKEVVTGQNSNIAPGKSGMADYINWAVNVKKTNGTSIWSPLFDNSIEPRIRSTFETANGTIFVATNQGFFKTDNDGQTWKQVYNGNYAGHLAEQNGVLVAIGRKKLIRSADNGETWVETPSEDGVAFDVKPIEGGFVAITAASEPGTRRLSTSYDGGKTWQVVDASARNKAFVDSVGRNWNNRPNWKASAVSVTQIGDNLFCTHANGIFRSSDKGKTWTLLLPAVADKYFNLFISGKMIYAITSKGGC